MNKEIGVREKQQQQQQQKTQLFIPSRNVNGNASTWINHNRYGYAASRVVQLLYYIYVENCI